MKKKPILYPRSWIRGKRKLFNVMRLTFIFYLLSLLSVSAVNVQSQNVKLSLSLNNVTLEQALDAVKKQSNYSFWFRDDEINLKESVSINVKKESLDNILSSLLLDSGLNYKIEGAHIILYKESEKKENSSVKQNDNTVRGKIADPTGQGLPGVNVVVKGSANGVVSDVNGYYVIKAQRGDILVFSYIGFKSQEVTVGRSPSLDVILQEDVQELDEAVVVGMGKQRKASVIGSIAAAPVENLRIPQRSLTSALSGRIAGAVVVQRSGEPGQDNADFWVRGISSFGANQKPLVLVDGVERDMSDLSIEEVESISILKDASATAVYGVRAANGVVLVTTRKGVAQKPTVEVKLEYGMSDLPNVPKLLGGADYAMLYNEAFGQENYSQDYIDNLRNNVNRFLYPNVNWFDELFKKYSTNANASLNIRGGGERARYYISASFIEDNGNLKNSPENDYKSNVTLRRYNFRSNVDVTLTKTTTLNIELGANLTDTHQPGVGNETLYGTYYTPVEMLYYYTYLSTPLSCPVRLPIGTNADGSTKWGWGAPAQVGEVNPAERLYGSGYNKLFRTQIMSQIILNQDLSFFLDGLDFRGSFSFDSYSQTIQNRRKTSTTYSVDGVDDETGNLIFSEVDKGADFLGYKVVPTSNRAEELKLQLNYNQLFNDMHRVGAMVMYYQRDYVDGTAESAIKSLPYKKQGLAFRGTYAYKDKYFAEFNVGYNGSENFPKGHRFGVFPAGALGYLISNESFWHVDAINVLKLRGSIGLVGSESLPENMRFGYLSTYGGGLGSWAFGLTPSYINGVGELQVGVPDLTWEKGLKKDVGIELKMFNNAVSLDFDYFHEKRSDILIQRASLPAIAGLNQQPFANMGVMTNQGVDGTLEFNHKIGKVEYRLYGNFTFTRNKILEMDEPEKKWAYRMRTGNRYNQQFGLIAIGLFKDQAEIDDPSTPVQKFGVVRPGDVRYKDVNGDGVIDIEDEVPIGYSSIPEINYGFGTQLSWNGFDFGVFFRGQANVSYALGGSTFIPFNEGVGKGNLFEKALDRWTEENPNPNAFYPRLSNGRSTNNWQASTRNIYNGNLLRLADIELGYSFKKKWLAPLGIKMLRVYVLANNVALFSKWDMWDPETGTSNGNKYPLPRKVNFGIRTSF
ncbi:SusC/RagA family TonB-linked outer membrane protein [Parabacteroides bouchesdurhonensis]|uniref:SusC/RagA family TonB-linked outer membrane protein n=1 Tax=Parabacteroides bouchesdurhonensis TaxID=1936995 RepID=UPI000E4C43C2|nr:TonB-dependent receptor [Parabacteroides bouchesdurhonensis]RHJ94224.1 TonB-dependent receptor [Bacteroides sp. AM07-16]